jgi:cytochrome c
LSFSDLRFAVLPALAATLALSAAPAHAQSAGEQAFASCKACHSVKPNEKRMGPSLFGVVGRAAGTQAGFAYSPAMKASKIVWTKAELDTFLKAPAKRVPGTRMPASVPDAARRAALVSYLAMLK